MPIGFNTAGTIARAFRLKSHASPYSPIVLYDAPLIWALFIVTRCSAPKTFPRADEKFQHLLPGLAVLSGKHLLFGRIKIHLVHQVAREKSSSRPSTIVASTPTFTLVPSSSLTGIQGRSTYPGDHHHIAVTTYAGRNCILNIDGITGIDIPIYNNNVF